MWHYLLKKKIGSFQCDCLTISMGILRLQSSTQNQPHGDGRTPTQKDILLLSPITKYLVPALASYSQKTVLSISPLVQKSSIFSDCQGTSYWGHHSRPSAVSPSLHVQPLPLLLQRLPGSSPPSLPTVSYIPPSPIVPRLHLSRCQPSFKAQLKSSLVARSLMPFQPTERPSPFNAHVAFADTVTALYSSPWNNTDLNCSGPLIHRSTYMQGFLYSTVP